MVVADFMISLSVFVFMCVSAHTFVSKRECDEKSLLSHPIYVWRRPICSAEACGTENTVWNGTFGKKTILEGIVSIR